MKTPVYLDYNATTPVDERVFDAMKPYFVEKFGNAASRTHAYGWEAEEAVERARAQIAKLINAGSKKLIIFNSGATEGNNTVIKGVAYSAKKKPAHVITQVSEHKCVLDSCKEIEKEGHEVTYLPVDDKGRVSPKQVADAIKENTVLVSIMLANNEIGTIQPIREIAEVVHEHKGILVHTDAAQAVGKVPVDVEELGVDLLTMSGHKLYGPKGVGALYIAKRRPPIRFHPLVHGGGHERGKRSGTLAVPIIVGFGAAAEIAGQDMTEEMKRTAYLRDKLESEILKACDYVHVNGDPDNRLPGTTNLSFEFIEGESLIMGMPDLCVASGSACTSASLEPSHVIQALGVKEELAHSSIRFGIGRQTTEEEVDFALEKIKGVVEKLRAMSPLYEMAQEGIDIDSIKWTAGGEH